MIRAEIRFKNATFMRALKNNGYKSILQFSKFSGIGYQTLIDYASLRNKVIDLKKRVIIADLLKLDIDVLFDQYDEVVEKNKKIPRKIIKDIPIDKMLSMTNKDVLKLKSDYNTDDIINQESLKIDIKAVLNTLKDREKEFVILHFGLEGEEPLCVEEIGKKYKISRERARQILMVAMRRISHRSRKNSLRQYIRNRKEESRQDGYDYLSKYSRELTNQLKRGEESD